MQTAHAAYQIPTYRLDELVTKVKRLARRAKKLSMPAVELLTVHESPRVCVRDTPSGRLVRYELPCTWVELVGCTPVVNGHTFVARLEHTEAGNMVSSPDHGAGPTLDLSPWYNAKANCDHCEQHRRRNDTFLLSTPDGVLKQIGRNCLADYLRSADVEVAVGMAALIEELYKSSGSDDDDFEFGGGGRWAAVVETPRFIACSVSSVRHFGYRKTGTEGGSTKQDVSFLVGPLPEGDSIDARIAREDWRARQPTEADVAKAVLVRAWVLANTEAGDYMHNLRIACTLEGVAPRQEGVLASAVACYDRAMGADQRREVRTESAFQGIVGARQTRTLTVGKIISWDNEFGTTHLHLMRDEAGNVFSWKSSGKRLQEGRTYAVKGTVKKHEEYKGTKQTTLTRCACETVAEVTA